ncbi:DUF2975 domain-containing protein [Actinoplanes sichuanensis]|uniref:DUF2975 domain-containing protein n=1 Tax=Actinoplanes sichuanensis TaxID=512349 RepID=UPI002954179E|nr:DUF2975 domain-containing protein [Actinoplanes sichuanensis]
MRRPDWLDELHGLLTMGVVLTGIGGAVTTIGILMGRPFDVQVSGASLLSADVPLNLPPGTSIDSAVSLQVDHPTGAQRAWELLATLPAILLLLLVLFLLWRLVGRARHDDPFTGGIVTRFRALGLLSVIGGPVVWAIQSAAGFALSTTLKPLDAYTLLDFAVPGSWLLFGFGMFAIAEIVRRGRSLRAELDEVV